MALLSVDTLFTPVTKDQALETFLSSLETLGVPARSWRTGGALRNILSVVAASFSGFTTVMSEFAKSGFLDSADGGWLTLLAHFVYGVDRRPATFAQGQVLFTNVGGAVYDGTNAAAGTIRPLWVAGGKAYVTLEDLNLPGPSTQLVNIQAVELGSASSAGPGLITSLETTLLGVTISNPLSVVGSDEQDDESLRQLCRDKLSALSLLGPRGAYQYAIGVAKRMDGSPVDINRVSLVPSTTTGIETVYVASPSGAPLSADLDLVRDSIELWARPDSVTAVVTPVTTVPFSKSLTIWAKHGPGIAAGDISAAVDAALVAMVAGYDIGGVAKPPSLQGYLYATNIEGTAKGAHPSIFAVDGVGGDLALNAGQVATLATTLTVRLV
jgi:hypothetical protein